MMTALFSTILHRIATRKVSLQVGMAFVKQFCKTYSDIFDCSQCGRCGRIGHDALDPFVCQLNGFESLPPLNEEEDRKKMEERKAMNKKKLVSRFASPKSSKNFHSLSLKLSQSPKKYFH